MRHLSGASAEAQGQRYLETLPVEHRRAAGQVYTPSYLADFVLDQAGFARAADGATLLDPSCGAGVFLERAVAILADRLVATRGGRADALGPVLAEAVERQLFGIDIDDTACEMTREAVRRAVVERTGAKLSPQFFKANVVRADFLFDDLATVAPKDGFSFVVGNPPYVATTRLAAKYKERLRGAYQSASGRVDLYTVFMERALTLLARRGRLAFLTPDKFLVSQSARELRSLLLTRNAIVSVARFRSHKVFSDAATVPCVTVVERSGRPRGVTVLTCGERPDGDGRVAVLDRAKVEQRTLTSSAWHLHALDRHALAKRLQGAHPTLAHLTVRVSAGPATGRDGVFVFPRGTQPEIEETLLRPVVRGRDLDAFRIEDPELDMLVPYTFDRAGNSALIEIGDFPGARRYLQRHRADLEARHCVRVWGKRWYDLHDQMLSDLAAQPKILVPDVANANRFAVDRGRYLPLHSVYYLVPRNGVDADYLCAVLNSRVAQFLVRLFSPVVKDGFNRYRQQFLASLPVPLATTEQTAEIATAAREGRHDELHGRLAHLFHLTAQEYEALDQQEDGEGAAR